MNDHDNLNEYLAKRARQMTAKREQRRRGRVNGMIKSKSAKKSTEKAPEKNGARRVSWTAPDVIAVLKKVNDGVLSIDAAAGRLVTDPHYVAVRSGWLKQFGTAAEPKETGAHGKGAKKKRTAKKTK